jgi:hypothetical protein
LVGGSFGFLLAALVRVARSNSTLSHDLSYDCCSTKSARGAVAASSNKPNDPPNKSAGFGRARGAGHTHSTGVFALKRQLVCVTILETESSYSMSNSKTVLGKEIPIWETRSAIEVYSWESGELLSTIVMPGGTFHGVLAISADERYLYVGGNLFLRRFEIPNLPEAKDGD